MMTNEEVIKTIEVVLVMFDAVIEALEKQIPKEAVKPDSPYFRYACPSCGNYPVSGHYCSECGQAIVYSKESEG